MAKKKDDFLDCLRILQDKYNREPRIAVVRLQSKPEDAFAPPKFGNVIIVWNPVQDSQYLTLQVKRDEKQMKFFNSLFINQALLPEISSIFCFGFGHVGSRSWSSISFECID